MKRKVIVTVLTAALVMMAGLAGTLAWFTDTETASNVVDRACDYYWADVNVDECRAGQWVPAVRYNHYTGVLTEGQCQITADGSGKKLGSFQAF